MPEPSSFFEQLKRRRVFRVAGVYAVVAWAVIQAAELMLPRLGLPDWSVTLVLALAILGFPIAVVLAWAFDVTPEGVRRATATGVAHAPRRVRAGQIAVAGAVVVLAGAGVAFFAGSDSGLIRERVAVAAFENETGDASLDPLGRMAADWILRGIGETGSVDVVPAVAELGAESGNDRDRVRALAGRHAAGTIVTGRYYRQGDSVLVVAQITDVTRGKLLRTLGPVATTAAEPLEGVERLRQITAGALVAILDPQRAGLETATSQPPAFEAYRAVLDGDQAFNDRDFAASARHYERAAALDSAYVYPLIRAAYAYNNLRQCGRVEEIGSLLGTRRDRMSAYEAAYLDRVVARCRLDFASVYRASREMLRLAPKSPIAAYIAARDAIPLNRLHEARSALEALDLSDPALPNSPYVYADLAGVLHMLGEHGRELRLAREAVERFPTDLYAAGLELVALAARGDVDRVEALLEDVVLLAPSMVLDPATLLLDLTDELRAHGHAGAAEAVASRALSLLRAGRSGAADPGPILLRALESLKRSAEATTLADSLLGERPDDPGILGARARLALAEGDTAMAHRLDGMLAAASSDPQRMERRVSGILERVRVTAAAGRSEEAVQLLQDGLAAGLPHSIDLHRTPELVALRNDPALRRLMDPKR